MRPPAPSQKLTIGVYSTFCRNVPKELLEAQKDVFEHLVLPLSQVELGGDEGNDHDKVLRCGHFLLIGPTDNRQLRTMRATHKR